MPWEFINSIGRIDTSTIFCDYNRPNPFNSKNMTRTRSKHSTQKVSVHRNKMFSKQTLSIGTTRNRSSIRKGKPISNL